MQNLCRASQKSNQTHAESNRKQPQSMQNPYPIYQKPNQIHSEPIRNPTKPWIIYQIHIMIPAIGFQEFTIGMLTPLKTKKKFFWGGRVIFRQPTLHVSTYSPYQLQLAQQISSDIVHQPVEFQLIPWPWPAPEGTGLLRPGLPRTSNVCRALQPG
jgi:hypothetical protein